MSSMSRKIVALLIVVLISQAGWSVSPDELSEMLARAEALYYEADFAKSVELLLHADELLRPQAGHLTEKTQVKLQLALGYIGLNDTDRAKAYLEELYALDADHQLDPQLFSPKVLRMADEAKADQNELRCRSITEDTQKQLSTGNGDGMAKLIAANQAQCSGLAAFTPKAADLIFKDGLDAYKKNQMTVALQKFRAALAIEPKHELAAQYMDLTESKLELTAERVLLTWNKDFGAGDFAAAKTDYQELGNVSSAKTMDEVRSEYRQALTGLVDSWNKDCARNDATGMENIRVRVNTLLPEPSFGEDVLAQMKTCAPTGCIQMGSHFALARLAVRVEPQLPAVVKAQVRNGPVRVIAKTRVNEKGAVVSAEFQGGTPLLYDSIRSALERWRFSPALTENGPRCFDTEIPFVINVEK